MCIRSAGIVSDYTYELGLVHMTFSLRESRDNYRSYESKGSFHSLLFVMRPGSKNKVSLNPEEEDRVLTAGGLPAAN